MFVSKTGQLFWRHFLPKHPWMDIWYEPLHFFASVWCKLSPKLKGCDFSFLQTVVACVIYWEHLFTICVWYIIWGWPDPQKRVFLRFRDTVFQSEERIKEGGGGGASGGGGGGGVKTSRKKCQYFYWVIVVFFALLKAMNLFHLYKKK